MIPEKLLPFWTYLLKLLDICQNNIKEADAENSTVTPIMAEESRSVMEAARLLMRIILKDGNRNRSDRTELHIQNFLFYYFETYQLKSGAALLDLIPLQPTAATTILNYMNDEGLLEDFLTKLVNGKKFTEAIKIVAFAITTTSKIEHTVFLNTLEHDLYIDCVTKVARAMAKRDTVAAREIVNAALKVVPDTADLQNLLDSLPQ